MEMRGLLLVSLLLASGAGCEAARDEGAKPAEATRPGAEEGGAPGAEAAPGLEAAAEVGRWGAWQIDLDDYACCLARLDLLARPPSAARKADPSLQQALVRQCLRGQVVRSMAAQREMRASEEDFEAALQTYPRARELGGTLSAVAAALEVAPACLRRALEPDIFAPGLTAALLAEIDAAHLEARFMHEHAEWTLEVVRFLNVPSSAEITHLAEGAPDLIEAYYAANKDRFYRPGQVTLRRVVLRVAADAAPETRGRVRQAAEEVRRRAALEDFAALASSLTEIPEERERGGLLPPMSPTRAPWTDALLPGSLSEVMEVAEGYAVYRLEARREGRVQELEPALAREIASLIIQERGAAPSVSWVAQAAQAALQRDDAAALKALLAQHPSDHYQLPAAPYVAFGRLPGMGPLPRLLATLHHLEPGEVSAPVLEGEQVYVVKVVARRLPDPGAWATQKAQYRQQVVERERGRILDEAVAAQLSAAPELDLRVLQRRYGVLRRDGVIEAVGD